MLPLCSTVIPSCSSHSPSQNLVSGGHSRKECEPRYTYQLNASKSCSSFLYGSPVPLLSHGSRRIKCAPSYSVSIADETVIDYDAGAANPVMSLVESVESPSSDVLAPIVESTPPAEDVLTLGEPTPFSDDVTLSGLPSNAPSNEMFPDAPFSLDSNPVTSVTTQIDELVDKIKDAYTDSVDAINSSIKSITDGAREGVDAALARLFSAVDQSETVAGESLNSVSTGLKEAVGNASVISVDLLRNAIVAAEDSLNKGASLIVYSYQSAKELLPPQTKEVLNVSEEKAGIILTPVAFALQQVFTTLESLERSLGFNPDDPIVSFSFLFGTSATLWILYWVWVRGGYSGNLSPESARKLLSGEESAALVDIRPENLRERDGIPDLRRRARFRYSTVALPEIDGSIMKMLKSGASFENHLLAVIIKNLKVVEDSSKIIVMDADGTRSKGVARSLRKLGVKKAYLLEGGFRAWKSSGLRIKELKSETALTVLGEEAEAIIEDVKATPAQSLSYGLALAAALYALTDWERSLQLAGVFGIGLSAFRRILSYEKPEDFSRDLKVLISPVALGARAVSWAAGKLESNGNGLPTSPSSSDVKNRVLQAAAKHESQPADSDVERNQGMENEKVDLSEA